MPQEEIAANASFRRRVDKSGSVRGGHHRSLLCTVGHSQQLSTRVVFGPLVLRLLRVPSNCPRPDTNNTEQTTVQLVVLKTTIVKSINREYFPGFSAPILECSHQLGQK